MGSITRWAWNSTVARSKAISSAVSTRLWPASAATRTWPDVGADLVVKRFLLEVCRPGRWVRQRPNSLGRAFDPLKREALTAISRKPGRYLIGPTPRPPPEGGGEIVDWGASPPDPPLG